MAGILVGNSSSNEAVGQLGWKGETGDSAYEIAVKHGYTGTEEQWSDDFLNAENYYDKSEADTLLSAKANSSDVYTKSQVYTKTETDNLLVDTYSTNEELTNKVWVDGKPIYRKTFYVDGFEATSTSGDTTLPGKKTIQTGLTGVITVIDMYGYYYADSQYENKGMFPINFNYVQSLHDIEISQGKTIPNVTSSNNYTWFTYFSGNDLEYPEPNINTIKIISYVLQNSIMKGYVTIEYTKPTDQGGN